MLGLRRAHPAAALAALAAAVAIGGCGVLGSGETPVASKRPTLPPTASPTLSLALGPFVSAIADPRFEFEATTDETLAAAASEGTTKTGVKSTVRYKAGDLYAKATVTSLGKSVVTEDVYAGNYRYSRRAGGKWTREDRPSEPTYLGPIQLFAQRAEIADLGIEEHNGKQLHRLTYAEGPIVDLPLVGVSASPEMTDTKAEAYFWAKDDGSPAGLSVHATWTKELDGEPVRYTLDYELTITKLSTGAIAAPKM